MTGKEKIIALAKESTEGKECFNEDGCKNKGGCFHEYCDKLKWILDRATHYQEVTGIDKDKVLESWEKDRTYSWMNYYQDANMPELDEKVKIYETVDDLKKDVGDKGFRCPACNGISNNPYACDSGQEMSKGKICDWKVYGLFGGLGKEEVVYVKNKMAINSIFKPIAWEE